MENIEVWKDIEGFDGQYQVSNTGRVASCKQQTKRIVTECIRLGYRKVHLSKGKKFLLYSVHRLMAQAFIPNPQNKPQINHINGIKSDNTLSNLEWCTNKENSIHAFRLGLRKPNGSKRVVMLMEDWTPIDVFDSMRKAARETGVPQQQISRCCKKKYPYRGIRWQCLSQAS